MASGNGVLPLGGPSSPTPAVSHMDVQGYRFVRWRVWLCHVGSVLSVGLLLLLFHWRPRLGVLARCRFCPLSLADILLIRGSCGEQYVVQVLTEDIEESSVEQPGTDIEENEWRDTVQLYKDEKALMRYYVFEGLRYVWMPKKGAFCRVSVLSEDWTCNDLYQQQGGLSVQEQSTRRKVYGLNLIDVPVKSYLRLLFEEVTDSFFHAA